MAQTTRTISPMGFERVLLKAVEAIALHSPQKALRLLVDNLAKAIASDVPESLRPYSSTWREAIACAPDYLAHRDYSNVLITRIFDFASKMIESGSVSLAEVHAILGNRDGGDIFTRLYLAVLAATQRPNATEVFNALLVPPESFGHSIEFWAVARRHLNLLSPSELEQFFERLKHEQPAPDSAHSDHVSWRLRDRLRTLSDFLSADDRVRLAALEAQFGDGRNLSEVSHRGATAVGFRSPLDPDAIIKGNIDHVLLQLRDWTPPLGNDSQDIFGPSPEGASRELRLRAKLEPDLFTNRIDAISSLEATYVRGVIDGLDDALRSGVDIDWNNVLRLSAAVVAHPNETYAQVGLLGRDPDWTWAKRALAGLLLDGLTLPTGFPIALRQPLWQIVVRLSFDPDPQSWQTPGRNSSSYANQAINSVQGTALTAVIRYALWVYRATVGDTISISLAKEASMPEVWQTLDRHLDRSTPDPIIWCVIGQNFAVLNALNSRWAEDHVYALFGDNPYLSEHTKAAWEAFLMFNQVTASTWVLLREQYSASVSALSELPALPTENDLQQPYRELAEHIFAQAMFGSREYSDSPMLHAFTEIAPASLLTHIMWFAAKIDSTEQMDWARANVKTYVKRRIDAGQRQTDERASIELPAFGNWYMNGVRDAEWTLLQTKRVIETVGKIDLAYRVFEEFAAIAPSHLALILDCVELLSARSEDPWTFMGAEPFIMTILGAAKRDAQHGEQIRRIVSQLIRRGWTAFSALDL